MIVSTIKVARGKNTRNTIKEHVIFFYHGLFSLVPLIRELQTTYQRISQVLCTHVVRDKFLMSEQVADKLTRTQIHVSAIT